MLQIEVDEVHDVNRSEWSKSLADTELIWQTCVCYAPVCYQASWIHS